MFCESDNFPVSLQFNGESFLTERCDLVIDPPLVIHGGVYPAAGFANEPGLNHTPDRSVEGARSHLYLAVRIGFDLLHNAVTVTVLSREGEQNMKYGGSKRRRAGVRFGHGFRIYP